MASRLSSLLVRDGLVGVKRMEQAFQRQVIYGGALDTILLEMNLVPEERLLQYLSLATGIPPATRNETDLFDPDAVKRCGHELAEKYQVAPIALDGDALRVLVKDPVDLAMLEELADELAMPIQPLVVPEYRFCAVRDRLFGQTTPARFLTLLKKMDDADAAAPAPVGKPRTVIIDAKIEEKPPAPPEVVDLTAVKPKLPRTTQRLSTDALARDLEKQEAARRIAAITGPHAVNRPPAAVSREGELDSPDRHDSAVPEHIFVSIDTPLPPAAPGIPQRRQWQREMELDATPLSPAEAMTLLAAAQDRDTVFGVLLRAIRGRAWYAGLLTVQGAAALGRIAIAGSRVDTESIGQVLIPLDIDSAFTKVVKSASPYIGPIATGDAEVDQMLRRLGGVIPPAALILPVALRNRVVALAIGHRGGDTIAITEVSGLLPLAGAAADALSRLIMRAKGIGYRTAAGGAPPSIAAAEIPSKELDAGATAKWTRPATADGFSPPPLDFGTEVSMTAEEPSSIGELFDLIEGGDDEVAAVAMAEAVLRPRETIAVLRERFPGKLAVDRYELSGRILRADQHGRLLDLVIRLGATAGDLLVDKMREGTRETRYYATLCAAELRPRSALPQLVERLFDVDYGVRETALRGLVGYPPRELDGALEVTRRLVHVDDVTRAQAAASALSELCDIGAIPDLLDATSRTDAVVEAARRSLVNLTKHDFGASTKKWRAWWAENKGRHRIEWLIDALGHKDVQLRRSAIEDLRRLTGEDLAYHHEAPRRDRDEAKERWEHWWTSIGKRRFLREVDPERHRPTAVLPRHPHE